MNSDIIVCLLFMGFIVLVILLIGLLIWLDRVNDVLHFYEFYREELEDLVFQRKKKNMYGKK